MADCDVNDIICQARVLASLENLKVAMSSEAFLAKFPEFDGIEERLIISIEEAQANFAASIEDCQLAEEWVDVESEDEE